MQANILRGLSRKPECYKKRNNQQTYQWNTRHTKAESTTESGGSRSIIHTYCEELNHQKTLKENKQEGVGWDHTGNSST